MKRHITLNITTEGSTERRFVDDILYPHLSTLNIFCKPRSVLTSQKNNIRGGMTSYSKAKRDISEWLRENKSQSFIFTTMFDFYGLPGDFPGMTEAKNENDPYKKVKIIEQAMDNDIKDHRFHAYIQLHEFEALIFSDLDKLLANFEGFQEAVDTLKSQLSQKDNNPELVNDNHDTSPSKRIEKVILKFQKATYGPATLKLIGLDSIRQKCRHFNEWVTKLENLE